MDEIRVGAEVDAHCTKCRMVTNHRIVAMVEDTIKRVICLTCDGQHNFRPPPGQKKTKSTRAKRVTKDQKRMTRSSTPQTYQKWKDLKDALPEGEEPRKYVLAESYSEDEVVMHSKFGLGFIQKLLRGDKIEVMFETEIKTLVMNYKQ